MASSFSTRRPAIDPEEVFRAADTMISEGKQVTALAILDVLGGGSLRTIYKHLTEWEKNRKEAPHVASSSDVPEPVKAAFASVLANTWKVAAAEAAKEVTEARGKAAAEVAEAQAKFEGALEGIQKLETQTEQDAALIDELKVQVLHLQEAFTKAGNENAALKAIAEELRNHVQSHQQELERLHKDVEADRKLHKEQIERMSADYAKLEERSTSQVDYAKQLQEQLTATQKLAEKAERERLELQVTADHTNKQLAQMNERAQISEQKQEQLNKEREAAMKEAAELSGQMQALKTQNGELMNKLSERLPKKPKEETTDK